MKFYNRVRVNTATVGQGTLTLGAAVGANMLTLAQAGAVNGDETTFVVEEGADFEISRGIIGGGGTTITRATVLVSKINGVAGTSKLELSGSGQVRFIQSADDINDLVNAAPFWQKLPEVVKTDNYTLTKADAGVALIFNKGTAITGSLPAVANSTSEIYIVRCLGAGTLTIDPNGAETIEGASTLALPTGMSAYIWPNSGKTAWRAAVFLSADSGAARTYLGAGGLASANTWTGANVFNGDFTLGSAGSSRINGVLGLNTAPVTDFWSPSTVAVQSPYGMLGSMGSFALGLYWNGYRNATNTWTSFNISGSTGGTSIFAWSGGIDIGIEASVAGGGPATAWRFNDTTLSPITTNLRDIGTGSVRVRTAYLVNNPNVSSDARYKLSRALTAAEIAAGVQMGRESILYQWLDKIAAEGAGVARLHAGIEAQTVARIMADNGLDVARYGFWCADPLTETEKFVDSWTYEKDVTELGPNGQPVVVKRMVTEEFENERHIPVLDGNGAPIIYQSIRYGELSAFVAAAQAAHMDSLEARIAALEAA